MDGEDLNPTADSIPPETPIPLTSLKGQVEFADSSILWTTFVDSLVKGRGQVRIIYYGDSQLEGDRITDFLRSELRKEAGGTGPGLLGASMVVPYTRSAWVRSSPNWKRYNYLSYRAGEIASPALGPMMSYSRFTAPSDSTRDVKKAWIRVTPSVYADSLASVFDRLRIFYGNLEDTLLLTISGKKKIITVDTLLPSMDVSEYSARLGNQGEVNIAMEGKSSPDLYGFSIESDTGLIVDNISSRGSAGLEFTLIGRQSLEGMYRLLSPDLLVLHYGLNVVRNESSSYLYYENAIYRQLVYLKQLLPGTAILVVGITDMARPEDEEFHSYPNLELIAGAQRGAADRAGVLFWDSRRAMGGADAAVSWKEHDPPLVADDYTHLTYRGGDSLAVLLVDAIRGDFNRVSEETDTVGLTTFRSDSLPPVVAAGVDTVPSDRRLRDEVWAGISRYDASEPFIFTNIWFWVFLLVLLTGYSFIFGKPVFRNSYLFAFSLFFYYKSGGLFFFLLIISTLTDYFAAWLIYAARRRFMKRMFVFFSLLVNLGMLGYFKYTGFITGVINDIFDTSFPVQDWLAMFSNNHLGSSFDVSVIILPVGISFFTFQTISYTLDVYRGRVEPVKNILDFGFYVSFFPQLVAGPIVRASEFIPQLYEKFSPLAGNGAMPFS
ncbi:MAG: hypothetical protein R2744_06635 [Bacteroidales bacterium]